MVLLQLVRVRGGVGAVALQLRAHDLADDVPVRDPGHEAELRRLVLVLVLRDQEPALGS